MLRHTFLLARGVGSRTERWLWQRGIRDWHELDAALRLPGMGPTLARRLGEGVGAAREALAAGDAGWFHRRLPAREGWRLYGEFRGSARFLDIETDGIGMWKDGVTVIGISDGRTGRAYVAGRDLERFEEALEGAALLVTFNGKAFDVPFIRRRFPWARLPAAHIDLLHVFRSLGLRGGLKAIERATGLSRGPLDGVDGAWAVALWERHLAGDPRALGALVRYNLEDAVNLRYLMDWAYNACLRRCGGPGAELPVEAPPALPIDRESLALLREMAAAGLIPSRRSAADAAWHPGPAGDPPPPPTGG
ncbi:MAG TPA: ribonuclease H-like domain-containing protein [Candidatus Polarisedimenticolia bacterium]|nr:ribonuclease H-like domain-containing protein [Candidatus Polarisedimenticolia bacterium]